MRLSQRLIAATVFIALSAVLGGCSGNLGGNFDPSDLLDFLDTKKKLAGERKPVFPEGVPGLEQGVPKELYKGSVEEQQQLDQHNAQTATAAPPPAPEEPKAKKSKGKKPKKQAPATGTALDAAQEPAAAADPNAAPDPNAASEEEGTVAAAPPPPKPKKIVRKRTTAPPPDQQAAQPAQQPAATAQQQSAPPFPAPLPSTSFQR
jgi:hypothetical protein